MVRLKQARVKDIAFHSSRGKQIYRFATIQLWRETIGIENAAHLLSHRRRNISLPNLEAIKGRLNASKLFIFVNGQIKVLISTKPRHIPYIFAN
jgi:hypothetical protein